MGSHVAFTTYSHFYWTILVTLADFIYKEKDLKIRLVFAWLRCLEFELLACPILEQTQMQKSNFEYGSTFPNSLFVLWEGPIVLI